MNKNYREEIRDRFLNTVFSLRKSKFLEKFNIDNTLGSDDYPGYILTHKVNETSLVICIKKINMEYVLKDSEGYVVSITQKENEEIICSKTMWFYSSSLIGNSMLVNDEENTLYGNDMISLLKTAMDALEFKFNSKNIINDADNIEYQKYEKMFDMCDKLGKIYY